MKNLSSKSYAVVVALHLPCKVCCSSPFRCSPTHDHVCIFIFWLIFLPRLDFNSTRVFSNSVGHKWSTKNLAFCKDNYLCFLDTYSNWTKYVYSLLHCIPFICLQLFLNFHISTFNLATTLAIWRVVFKPFPSFLKPSIDFWFHVHLYVKLYHVNSVSTCTDICCIIGILYIWSQILKTTVFFECYLNTGN